VQNLYAQARLLSAEGLRPMRTTHILPAVASIFLVGCSKSDLDRCIDDQMAVWSQREQTYQDEVKNYKPPAETQPTVNVGGLSIDPNMLPAFNNDPGTKEEAEARADLQCGKIYGKHG